MIDQAKPREDDPEPPRETNPPEPDSGDRVAPRQDEDQDQGRNEAKEESEDPAVEGERPQSTPSVEDPNEEDATSAAVPETGPKAVNRFGPGDDEGYQTPSSPDDDPPPPQDLTAAVRAAADAGSRETGELLAAISRWGFEPGDLKRVPLGERIELARKLRTRRLKDLAKMLGRMKNTKRAAEKKKLRNHHGEKYSVTISGDLERTLPSERASAFGSGDEYRELDFYRKLSENKVASYDLRTVEDVGRGPVIAMIDASTSMSGERMEWASSLTLALAHPGTRRLIKSDRHLYAIFFNTRIILEVDLEPGENDLQKLVSIGTVAPDGGTRYVEPMTRAMEVASEIDERPPTKRRTRNKRANSQSPRKPKTRRVKSTPADLLLITDGECKLPEPFTRDLLAEKKRRGFRIVSVLIGNHTNNTRSLEPFSDLVIPVAYLGGSSTDEAAKIFDALGTSKS